MRQNDPILSLWPSRLYFWLLLLLTACIEPFDFLSIDFESKLVVDASLTNEAKAHVVELSYTFPLDTSLDLAATNARVAFIEASGNRVPLTETSSGRYVTQPDYAGIPGHSYQLSIVLPDGTEFLSDSEVMLDPVPIDSVYAQYTSIPIEDENGNDFTGVQVFVDSHSEAPERHSFRYDYEESYEIVVPNPSEYGWTGNVGSFEVFRRETPLGTCYRTGHPQTQLLATTRGLSENRILAYRVRFISEAAQHLAYQYIIEVSQRTISNEAYTFFRQLREANESNGSLSDKQLGTMPSNITNVENPLDFALGYFEVAGVSKAKKRMSYRDFLDEGIQTEEWVCQPHPLLPDDGSLDLTDPNCYSRELFEYDILSVVDTFQVDRSGDTTFFILRKETWELLADDLNNYACSDDLRITSINPAGTKAFVGHHLCSDCTTYGTLERPAVWDD